MRHKLPSAPLYKTNLCLGIGSEPGQSAGVTELRQLLVELMSEENSERHALFGLVRGIAEHEPLITGTNIFLLAFLVNTCGGETKTFIVQ